jgi:phosphoglycerate dehydrogenase-like enzyme
MNKPSLAILDDYQNVAQSLLTSEGIGDGVELRVFNDHLNDEKALVERLQPYEMICLMRERTPFRRSLFAALPNLRLLVTSGMRNASVDLDAARERGVVVCGTSSVGAPTAELAWGLIIGLLRRIPGEDRATRAGAWQRSLGVGLNGRTLGVVGLGKLGSCVARVGLAFDMEVVAWSQNLTRERCEEVGVSLVTKDELLGRSDVISIHLVLSDRTRGLFGAAELALMKSTAVLINTSRGPIVDESALVDALQRKAIGGAGLDVFDREPLPAAHPLLSCDNTVITPHLGYVEQDNYRAYFGGYVSAIRAYLAGAPVNVIK